MQNNQIELDNLHQKFLNQFFQRYLILYDDLYVFYS